MKVDLALGDVGDVGVGEGVVADLVAFTVDPLHDAYVVLGDFADFEEGAFDVVAVEDVEDLRGPDGVGAVVEGEGDLFGDVAVLREGVGQRVAVEGLIDDGEVLRGDGFVIVEFGGAVAVLREAGDAEDIAVAFGVDVLARGDTGELPDDVGGKGIVPDVPDGGVFKAKTPESESLEAEGAGDTHLVDGGDGVEEPDLVALLGVFVVVGEVRVEGGVVEVDFGFGVGGALPGVLGGDHGDADGGLDGFWGGGGALRWRFALTVIGAARWGGRCGGEGKGPVIAVIADRANDFLPGNDFHGGFKVVFEPILGGYGAGDGGILMLTEIHEDDAVGMGGEEGEVVAGVADGNADVELEAATVEVGGEGLDEGAVGRESGRGNFLKAENEAAIASVGGHQRVSLGEKGGAGCGAAEKGANSVGEDVFEWVEVVDQGEDLRVFLGSGDGLDDLVFLVDAVDARSVDDGERAIVAGVGGKAAVLAEDMEPLGKEDVDLFYVLFEAGVAGGIDVIVEGGTEAFALVQDDVGGLEIGVAVNGMVELFFGGEFRRGRVEQRAIAFGGRAEVERPEGAHFEQADDEEDADDGAGEGECVEDAAETLPAFALGIVKDGFARGAGLARKAVPGGPVRVLRWCGYLGLVWGLVWKLILGLVRVQGGGSAPQG